MKYLFLNSYFDAIEKKIADDVDFDRMINAEGPKQAFEVLQDTDYAKWALESKNLEKVFEKEKKFFREELVRMGVGSLADIFSLKANIVNLRILLKREIFGLDSGRLLSWGKNEEELRDYFSKEIEEAIEIETPAKLDDYLTEAYLNRLEEFSGKDKSIVSFIKDYRGILENLSGEMREKEIVQLEEEFISVNRKKNEGLAPILAFFMKKWLAEKKVRTIIVGKEQFSSSEVKEMVEDLKSL